MSRTAEKDKEIINGIIIPFIPMPIEKKRASKNAIIYDNPVCNQTCVEETALQLNEPVDLVKSIAVQMNNFYADCIEHGEEVRIPHIGSFNKNPYYSKHGIFERE